MPICQRRQVQKMCGVLGPTDFRTFSHSCFTSYFYTGQAGSGLHRTNFAKQGRCSLPARSWVNAVLLRHFPSRSRIMMRYQGRVLWETFTLTSTPNIFLNCHVAFSHNHPLEYLNFLGFRTKKSIPHWIWSNRLHTEKLKLCPKK